MLNRVREISERLEMSGNGQQGFRAYINCLAAEAARQYNLMSQFLSQSPGE